MQKSKGNMHLQPPATFWSAQAAQRHVTPSTQTGSRRIEAVFFIYLYLQITKCFSNIVLDISCIYQHLQHVGHQRMDSVPPRPTSTATVRVTAASPAYRVDFSPQSRFVLLCRQRRLPGTRAHHLQRVAAIQIGNLRVPFPIYNPNFGRWPGNKPTHPFAVQCQSGGSHTHQDGVI